MMDQTSRSASLLARLRHRFAELVDRRSVLFMTRVLSAASVLAIACLFADCAAAPPAEEFGPCGRDLPQDVRVFATETGDAVDLDAMLAAIDAAEIVVLGELHGHRVGLDLNTTLFQCSIERHPNAALCLEFLTRESQHLVDAYLDGVIDWTLFESSCSGINGCSPVPHRPMIEAARLSGVPVIAANAPRIYTRAAREHGYARLASLTTEQRRLFDTPGQLPAGSYREGFFKLMRQHGKSRGPADASAAANDRIQGFYRAQCLWDMTMAGSVARGLESGRRPVFLVVGSFHSNRDGGTVQMIRKLRADAKVLVFTFVSEDSDELAEQHRELADYVAYVGPFKRRQ